MNGDSHSFSLDKSWLSRYDKIFSQDKSWLSRYDIAGGLQLWDVMTTPVEQIEQIKNSEDMKQIQENMRNLQDLINDKYGPEKNDKFCP